MTNNVRILLVMESDRRQPLVEHLKACGALVLVARNCLEAHKVLSADRSLDLVLADTTLSDGNWLTVLTETVWRESRATVVVCSDSTLNNVQLPAHVLAYGAAAFLTVPYDWQELDRLIAAATGDTRSPNHPYVTTGESPMPGIKEVVCTRCQVVVPLRETCTHCGARLPEPVTEESGQNRAQSTANRPDRPAACRSAA